MKFSVIKRKKIKTDFNKQLVFPR